MRTRGVVVYVAAGLALGALAGVAAAGAFRHLPGSRDEAFFLAAVAGGLVGAAGAVGAFSRRAALYECTAGVVMAVTGMAIAVSLVELSEKAAVSAGLTAAISVVYALAFSAVLGALHGWRYGARVAAPAALFAGIGGTAALFLATKALSSAHLYGTAAASGAIFGALVWGAVALARRLFGVDVEAFRVS